MAQPIIGIACCVLMIGFIVFAFKQGMKVTPNREGNGTNSADIPAGNDHSGGQS